MKSKTILLGLAGMTIAFLVTLLAIHPGRSSKLQGEASRTFEVTGEVRSIDIEAGKIRVSHEEIPGYMPAMTMSLPVKSAGLLSGISAGDHIRFQLVVTDEDSWIGRVERVANPGTATAELPVAAADREAERVKTGEVVPAFELIDQDGKAVRLADFKGKALVLTFIYTRCPLPNFCPLMSKNFAELQQRLDREFPGKYALLSVSIDPQFDQPPVLKEYGERYGRGKNWTLATGTAEQVQAVAGLMGLYYEPQNGVIAHDLRTALIGPDGRLVHLWKSNVWTPYEVQRMVRETLTGERDVAAR